MIKDLVLKAPHGPLPRPGLGWKEKTRRWTSFPRTRGGKTMLQALYVESTSAWSTLPWSKQSLALPSPQSLPITSREWEKVLTEPK